MLRSLPSLQMGLAAVAANTESGKQLAFQTDLKRSYADSHPTTAEGFE